MKKSALALFGIVAMRQGHRAAQIVQAVVGFQLHAARIDRPGLCLLASKLPIWITKPLTTR